MQASITRSEKFEALMMKSLENADRMSNLLVKGIDG